MIPGANVLAMAMRIIAPQSFQYNRFLSTQINSIGQDITIYAPPLTISGSAQPVPRNLYEQFGLMFDRNYLTFYVPQSMLDIARDISGDVIGYNCGYYQCVSKTNWFAQDGWIEMLAVEIPKPGSLP